MTSLPLFNQSLPSRHYSGYITGLPGNNMHYYFVEAVEVDPATAPVVYWTNGGPGCSSMDGWGYELGPFHFRDFGATGPVFQLNTQSWTRFANVVFVEGPPGVGFSYRDDGNTTTTDSLTAKNNYAALLDFFNNKFPEYKVNRFFIAGESYGGVYVPTLAAEILSGGGLPSFAGMLVGNGCVSADCDNFVEGDLRFAAYHHLIPFKLYLDGQRECLPPNNSSSPACQYIQSAYFSNYMANINVYGVTYNCFAAPTRQWLRIPSLRRRLEHLARVARVSVEEYLRREEASPTSPPGGNVPCIDSMEMQTYLNRADVKAALHVLPSLDWNICSQIDYHGDIMNVGYAYKMMLQASKSVLVYNGDQDTAVPYTTVEAWIDSNAKGQVTFKETRAMAPWTYSDALYPYGPQVGGYSRQFNSVMWFTTILGATHMVPQSRPAAALAMFRNFVNGTGF